MAQPICSLVPATLRRLVALWRVCGNVTGAGVASSWPEHNCRERSFRGPQSHPASWTPKPRLQHDAAATFWTRRPSATRLARSTLQSWTEPPPTFSGCRCGSISLPDRLRLFNVQHVPSQIFSNGSTSREVTFRLVAGLCAHLHVCSSCVRNAPLVELHEQDRVSGPRQQVQQNC